MSRKLCETEGWFILEQIIFDVLPEFHVFTVFSVVFRRQTCFQ